jgi:hypothetical protein
MLGEYASIPFSFPFSFSPACVVGRAAAAAAYVVGRAAAAAAASVNALPYSLLAVIAYGAYVADAATSQRCLAASSIRVAQHSAAASCKRDSSDEKSVTVPPDSTQPAFTVGNSQANAG